VPVRRSCGSPGDERPPPPDLIILWSVLNLGRNGGGSETAAPAHHAGLPAGDPTAATYSKIKGRADAESFPSCTRPRTEIGNRSDTLPCSKELPDDDDGQW
jgi:hypothetical protein